MTACGITGCARTAGHVGCHTSRPSAGTLNWDKTHGAGLEAAIHDALMLLWLDLALPTPGWADLRDPL